MKKVIIISTTMLLCFTAGAQINEVHKQLLNVALQNNHSIQQSALELEKQTKKVNEVRASGLPEIKATVNSKNYIDMPVVIIPGEIFGMPQDVEASLGKPNNMDAGISASQLLINVPFIYGLKTAKSAVELYELLKIKSEEDVIYQVSYAYYMYLASKESLKILYENLETIEVNKNITQSLVENNLALPSDILRLESKETELKNQVNIVTTSIREQEQNIALLLGTDKYKIPEIDDTLGSGSMELLLDSSVVERTELKMLKQQLHLSELSVKSSKASYYPTLSLYGNYMYNAQRDKFNYFDSNEKWNKTSLIGVQLSIPLFTGGKNNAKFSQAKIDYNITQSKFTQAKQRFHQEQSIAIDKYNDSREISASLYQNTIRAKDIYEITSLKYKEGLLPLTELLIADAEFSTAKLNYTKGLLDLYVAELNIYKANGQLITLTNN